MPDLPYVLWWTVDPAAMEWFRTSVAALAGALAGGLFTLRGQARAEDAQLLRDVLNRDAQLDDIKREALDTDMRALHSSFTNLMSEVDATPQSFAAAIGAEPWNDEWKLIWTRAVRTKLRVDADLIPDPATRAQVIEIISLLKNARDHSHEGMWPGAPSRHLRWVTGQLAAEGAAIMAAFLRREPHETERAELLETLRREEDELARWEEHEIERSDQQAEEWYRTATKEEIEEVEALSAALVIGRRRNPPSKEESPDDDTKNGGE